jgi:phosphatidylserine decarboxylase
MKLHKEGYTIILTTIIIAAILYTVNHTFLIDLPIIYWLLNAFIIVMLVLVIQFFRVPTRPIEVDENGIYCPADGKVVVIEETEETEYFKDRRIQISIFMSPLNVHANWNPISGITKYFKYHPGKFLVAWHPKSSTDNERSTVVVEHENGKEILFRQIAGAVARRIVCYAQPNQEVVAGSEFGFIKFGSRIDVFLPLDTEVCVDLEQKVQGKTTLLAKFK